MLMSSADDADNSTVEKRGSSSRATSLKFNSVIDSRPGRLWTTARGDSRESSGDDEAVAAVAVGPTVICSDESWADIIQKD